MKKNGCGWILALILTAALLAGGAFFLHRMQLRSAEPEDAQVTAAPASATPTPTPTPSPTPEPEAGDLVFVQDYIPSVFVELRYATANNFTGQVIYDFTEARLRYGTVQKLARVQQTLLHAHLGVDHVDGQQVIDVFCLHVKNLGIAFHGFGHIGAFHQFLHVAGQLLQLFGAVDAPVFVHFAADANVFIGIDAAFDAADMPATFRLVEAAEV